MLSIGQRSFGHVALTAPGLLALVEQRVVCTGGIGVIQSNESADSCSPIGPTAAAMESLHTPRS